MKPYKTAVYATLMGMSLLGNILIGIAPTFAHDSYGDTHCPKTLKMIDVKGGYIIVELVADYKQVF